MSRILLFILLIFSYSGINAQVTTFGDSKPEDFDFLPYAGKRVIQGFRVDMGGEKYCIVYSKSQKGVTPDSMFVQSFIKKDEKWQVLANSIRTSSNTLFIWGRRGGFFTDANKNGVAYTAFSEEDLETEKRFIVGYFILYKDEVYTIEESAEGLIFKSKNYEKLPSEITNRVEEAFGKLDKWKS